MRADLYVVEDDFRIYCYIGEEDDGGWIAWVLFERDGDYSAMKDVIPAMRHRIRAKFETSQQALWSALGFARERIQAGEVGL